MRFPIGAMTLGDILDRGLKLLLARLPTFYLISLIVQLPVLAYQLALPKLQGTNLIGTFIVGSLLVYVLTLIVQAIGSAATVHVVAKEFVDERVGIGAAFRFAFGRFGSLLLASFLVGLVVGVGLLLLVVPGIMFAVWYAFVGQVVVVEALGASKAMSRSKDLTKGFRWRVFGVLILMFVAGWILGLAILGLQRVFPVYETVTTSTGFRLSINYTNHIIVVAAQFLINALVGSFSAVCMTLLYFDLRIRKEGFDLELAARGQAPTVRPVPAKPAAVKPGTAAPAAKPVAAKPAVAKAVPAKPVAAKPPQPPAKPKPPPAK